MWNYYHYITGGDKLCAAMVLTRRAPGTKGVDWDDSMHAKGRDVVYSSYWNRSLDINKKFLNCYWKWHVLVYSAMFISNFHQISQTHKTNQKISYTKGSSYQLHKCVNRPVSVQLCLHESKHSLIPMIYMYIGKTSKHKQYSHAKLCSNYCYIILYEDGHCILGVLWP